MVVIAKSSVKKRSILLRNVYTKLIILPMLLFLVWVSSLLFLEISRFWSQQSIGADAFEQKFLRDAKQKGHQGPTRFAVFIQMGSNMHLLDDLLQCARHVVGGIPEQDNLDVHIALLDRYADQREAVAQKFTINSRVHAEVTITENKGADVGQFMNQLYTKGSDKQYTAILKIHAKSDDQWRQRMLESLCGSDNQVISILSGLRGDVHMVGALGTVFGPTTPLKSIYPRIVEVYNMKSTSETFDPETVKKMKQLSDKIGLKGQLPPPRIIAGTCFWSTWEALHIPNWIAAYSQIQGDFTDGYRQNLALEHIIERLIPTMVEGKVAEITPAPRVFALYFPQYHAFPENDRFWGSGFTEWTLLKPFTPKENGLKIRKPLSIEKGGLGYYNLLDESTRKLQADLAQEYGVTGFAIYHYWFSGDRAPNNHSVMTGVLDAMLRDGEPNIPFFFSWANEPWNRRWTGGEEEILLSQAYGDEAEWKEHFEYLLIYFRHENYERVSNRPVLSIYRPGHLGEKFVPMMEYWQHLALENGFPGLHIIQTVGNFYFEDSANKVANKADIQASFQFWPQLWACAFDGLEQVAAGYMDVDLKLPDQHNHAQYWGAFTGFDRRPRDASSQPIIVTPESFDKGLSDSFDAMSSFSNRRIDKNLFVVTAWNEWNEQALLEPDDLYEFRYLEILQHNLRNVPVHIVQEENNDGI